MEVVEKGTEKAAGKRGTPDIGARARLLASATGLFTTKGYAATTVREIVETAGVTKPVLYYYFRNKEGIFLDLMKEGWAKFESVLDTTKEEADATTKVLRLADRVLILFIEHIEVARLMYSIYYGPPQGAPFFDFDAYHLRFQDAVRQIVEEGVRKGEFRDGSVEDMTWAIIGAVNVAMELQLCHPEWAMSRESLSRVLSVIFAGIATEKGLGRGGRR